jgi:hypothetical protein
MRRVVCLVLISMVLLSLLVLALPSGKAQGPGLEQRVKALEDKLAVVMFDAETNVLTSKHNKWSE